MQRWNSFASITSGLICGAALFLLLPDRLLFHTGESADAAATTTTGSRYACPMMCFIGYQEAECPVCGMDMTAVSAGELNAEQIRRIELQTHIIDSGPALATLRAFGRADYDHRFTRVVIPRVNGRIVQRFDSTFGCCEQVHAGDPIVELYSIEVIQAQGELQAALRMNDPRLLQSIKERFSRWNLAEVADAIIAGEPIRDTVMVRSPFTGTVLLLEEDMRNEALAVGRELRADTVLLRLVQPDRRVLILEVPEARSHWLREGQPVDLETDTFGRIHWIQPQISRVSSEIEPLMRTREVRIYLTDTSTWLAPGTLVSARIRVALDGDLQAADPDNHATWGRFVRVPKTAVLSTGVRHVAWTVSERSTDGSVQFALAPLALGPRIEDEAGNDFIIVRAGLQAGDEVAVNAAFLIDSQAQLAGTPSLIYPAGASAIDSGGHSH